MERRLAAILAADVVGYSRLMGEGKWPSGHRKTKKSGHRLAVEKTLFPRRVVGGYDLRKPRGHLGNVGVVVEVRDLGAFGDWEKAGGEVKGL